MKYSKNVKLNKVLNQIEKDLNDFDLSEIAHFMQEFPKEPDYNIAQYGCVKIYHWEIRKMYIDAGYKTFRGNRISNSKMRKIYRKHVGYVARELMKTATF